VDTSNWGCTWEELKRFTAGRSLEDKVFFAVHGHWPDQTQQAPGDNNDVD
jgi:hypothetical protein